MPNLPVKTRAGLTEEQIGALRKIVREVVYWTDTDNLEASFTDRTEGIKRAVAEGQRYIASKLP